MSLEKFCLDLDKEIRALKIERSGSIGQTKGAYTRRINKLESMLNRAVRRGIKE